MPPGPLHPTQGSLPCGKLDSQPPLQLLADRSSFAILPMTESGAGAGVRAVDGCVLADRVWRVDDVGRDAPVSTTRFGVAAGFGASTVTEGTGTGALVVVCDAAGPHSMTVDRKAKAEGATNFDDSLMNMSFQGRIFRPNAFTPPNASLNLRA